MKNTIFAVAVAAFSLNTVSASTDFIQKAIEKGQLSVIKTCNKIDYAVALEDKEAYLRLAQQIVEQKKEAAKTGSKKSLLTVDNLILTASVISIVALARDAYDKYNKDKAVGENGLLFWAAPAAALSATKAADVLLKSYKDVVKEDTKAKDAITNAEKVAQAVSELAIS